MIITVFFNEVAITVMISVSVYSTDGNRFDLLLTQSAIKAYVNTEDLEGLLWNR